LAAILDWISDAKHQNAKILKPRYRKNTFSAIFRNLKTCKNIPSQQYFKFLDPKIKITANQIKYVFLDFVYFESITFEKVQDALRMNGKIDL
jgi:hypothetical protein